MFCKQLLLFQEIKTMAKRSIDEILDDSCLPENVTKRKYNYVLTGEKVPLFPSMNSQTTIFLSPLSLNK